MKPEKRLTPELRKMFPKDFFWGASVSSHQVEGGTYNQWTVWEQHGANDFAKDALRKWSWLPVWKDIKDQARDPENYVSGRGVDHYHYYKKDLALLKPLGLNAFRFGIEWSRIEPQEGVYNLEALQFYKDYLKELRKNGLEPFLNIWHWTNPVWFEQKGGFAKRSNLQYWKRFIEKISDELDLSKINYILTINEANSYMGWGFVFGEFPPGEKNFWKAFWVYRHLGEAHRIAYRILTSRHRHLKVGLAHQINHVIPGRKGKISDEIMTKAQSYVWNWWFLNRIKRQLDFIGVNYYFTDYRYGFELMPDNPSKPTNDLGWYMAPANISFVLNETYRRYKKPLIVTENGVADMHDQYREWWISETMHALSDSLRSGTELLGYLHWSLLDNFEWQYGWFPKFGLISTDRHTKTRKLKNSTKKWSNWLRQR